MRSLIIRFIDCEGPGIIEDSLRKYGYTITYHNAYKKSLGLLPESHQVFDAFVLMGGPQSVAEPKQYEFFKPYYRLLENVLALNNKKILGVCLGSQIIAKVLGAEVKQGDKGFEVGFSKVKIESKSNPIFQGIESTEIDAFHLHEDTFSIPDKCNHLLSSSVYSNQMFSMGDSVYAIQCHLEVTYPMLEAWWRVHKNIEPAVGKLNSTIQDKQQQVEKYSRIIFDNIFKK